MQRLSLSSKSWILANMFVVTFLLVISLNKDTHSQRVDTLNLHLQWAYPISVTDMKLVDFDLDGLNEILTGFKADSSHVGILDFVGQRVVWQSHGLPGSALTVAAGYRNEDNILDIIVGGAKAGYSADVGYFQAFDWL